MTPLGYIYDKQSFTGVNELVPSGSGITRTLSGNAISVVTTAAAYTNYLILSPNTVPYNTDLENWIVAATITVGAVGAATYGVALGTASIAAAGTTALLGIAGQLYLQSGTGGNVAILTTVNGAGTQAALSPTAITFAAGHVINMTFQRNRNTFTLSAWNTTVPQAPAVATYSFSLASATPQLPNIGNFAVYGVGSSFMLNALSVSSNQPASANVCAVGDSKTAGYYAGTLGQSFANILGITSTLSVLAGGSEMTADVYNRLPEIISLAPTCVLLCIGRNDVANGLPPPQYETTYRAIVTALQAASIRVVHVLPLYENSGISYTTLTNFIESTYPGQFIDTALYQFSPAYILNADNVHPSPAGHAQCAAVIQASGLLPIPMVYQDYLASQTAP